MTRRSFPTIHVLLALCVPLLAAPTCIHKSVHPTDCVGCTPAQADAKLTEAESNAVLALGAVADWRVLEPCTPCLLSGCFLQWPPANFEAPQVQQCDWENGLSGSCWCGYDTTPLDDYLDAFVDANASRGRRNFMVQLAPVFYDHRTTPPYLMDEPFDSQRMKDRYRRLLDHVLPVISDHVVAPGDPLVTIGLGNEINAYLNRQPDPRAAWLEYLDFLGAAKAHIDSQVSYTFETVTTTWRGDCGLGDPPTPSCLEPRNLAVFAGLAVDHFSFTYYPNPFVGDAALRDAVVTDFAAMAALGDGANKNVVVQEVGYPSANSASTQTVLLDAVFDAWANHYDRIKAVNYFNLNDFEASSPLCDGPGGELVCSWGLHDAYGNDKGAWPTFVDRMGQVPVD